MRWSCRLILRSTERQAKGAEASAFRKWQSVKRAITAWVSASLMPLCSASAVAAFRNHTTTSTMRRRTAALGITSRADGVIIASSSSSHDCTHSLALTDDSNPLGTHTHAHNDAMHSRYTKEAKACKYQMESSGATGTPTIGAVGLHCKGTFRTKCARSHVDSPSDEWHCRLLQNLFSAA